MRSVSIVVLLLLVVNEARGIRLDKGSFKFAEGRSKTQMHMGEEKSSTNSSKQMINNQNGNKSEFFGCKNGENCLEAMKKRAPNKALKKPQFHWLPGMQEDYHGPRTHKPRHH